MIKIASWIGITLGSILYLPLVVWYVLLRPRETSLIERWFQFLDIYKNMPVNKWISDFMVKHK